MNPVTISMDNFNEVFNQYDRYIKAIANKYMIKGYDFDDLVSIAYGTLMRCIQHYKIEIPQIYDILPRTGCMGCPYSRNIEEELKSLSDNQYKYVVSLFKKSYDVKGVKY